VIDAQKRVQGDFLQNPTRQEGWQGEKEGEQYRRRKRGNCRELEEQEDMRSRSEACDDDAMGAKHMRESERGTELGLTQFICVRLRARTQAHIFCSYIPTLEWPGRAYKKTTKGDTSSCFFLATVLAYVHASKSVHECV
jgi:hypothetical protein